MASCVILRRMSEGGSAEFLIDLKRARRCGELRAADVGKNDVVLMGWVATRRDHGGRVFIDLRDRTKKFFCNAGRRRSR